MAHQVFVGVAQQVVALGAVAAEIQPLEDGHQLGEPVHHLLALAELFLVVEVGDVDRALEAVVGVGQLADDLVDLVADLLVALGRHHVGKAAAGGHVDQGVGITGVFVGDVFDEQQDEDVILVLAGIHAAAQLVAGFPEGGIEFGFLEGRTGGTERSGSVRSGLTPQRRPDSYRYCGILAIEKEARGAAWIAC